MSAHLKKESSKHAKHRSVTPKPARAKDARTNKLVPHGSKTKSCENIHENTKPESRKSDKDGGKIKLFPGSRKSKKEKEKPIASPASGNTVSKTKPDLLKSANKVVGKHGSGLPPPKSQTHDSQRKDISQPSSLGIFSSLLYRDLIFAFLLLLNGILREQLFQVFNLFYYEQNTSKLTKIFKSVKNCGCTVSCRCETKRFQGRTRCNRQPTETERPAEAYQDQCRQGALFFAVCSIYTIRTFETFAVL